MVITLAAMRMAVLTPREFSGAKPDRHVGVLLLVELHLPDDGLGPGIALRQARQMPVQVGFDLPFGFGEETKVPSFAQLSRDDAERQCAGIPDRVEPALP